MARETSMLMADVDIDSGSPAPVREECVFDGRNVEEILTLVAMGHGLKDSPSCLSGLVADVVGSTLRNEVESLHKDHLRESGFITPDNDGCKTPEPHKMAPPPLVRPVRRPRAVLGPIEEPLPIDVSEPTDRAGPTLSFSFGCVPRAFHDPGPNSKDLLWHPLPRRGHASLELLDSLFAKHDEDLPLEPAAKRAKVFA